MERIELLEFSKYYIAIMTPPTSAYPAKHETCRNETSRSG